LIVAALAALTTVALTPVTPPGVPRHGRRGRRARGPAEGARMTWVLIGVLAVGTLAFKVPDRCR
jgi:hypothetical protein